MHCPVRAEKDVQLLPGTSMWKPPTKMKRPRVLSLVVSFSDTPKEELLYLQSLSREQQGT